MSTAIKASPATATGPQWSDDGQTIIWRCLNCGTKDDVIIWLPSADIARAQKEHIAAEEWAAEQRRQGKRIHQGNEIPSPYVARWRVRCSSCAAGEATAYWFAANRFDDLGKVLSWTIHLGMKVWLEQTNWRSFCAWILDTLGKSDA